jgi:hypothetical protein
MRFAKTRRWLYGWQSKGILMRSVFRALIPCFGASVALATSLLGSSIIATVATATIIEVDLLTPGDALVTRDTATGLDWLDLTQTLGLSVNDIRAGAYALHEPMFQFDPDRRGFLFHDLKEVRDGKQEIRERNGFAAAA